MEISSGPRPTTQAAEGLPRLRWTTDDLIRMVEVGLLGERDRVELIGGEIVPMAPAGRRHEVVRDEVVRFWSRRLPADVWVSVEPQFNLDANAYTEPDILVLPWSIKTFDLLGPDALVVVEVAETSLAYDIGTKAKVYASYGVREYWVINAVTLETHVHTTPGEDGYISRILHPPTAALTPHLAPPLTVRLADLDLG